MITKIQINENVKKELDKFNSGKETYGRIILTLMYITEENKRKQEELLIGGCREMAEENLKITKEFETIEDLDDWEW